MTYLTPAPLGGFFHHKNTITMETFKYPEPAALAKMTIEQAGALGGSAAEWYASARARHRGLREQLTEPHNPFEDNSFRNFWFRVTYEGTFDRLLATQAQ